MIEKIFSDLYASDNEWSISVLRYFNPIEVHESGRIGEDPNDIPNNLMPYITQVAVGKREKLSVLGDNCPSHDGTGEGYSVLDVVKNFEKAIGVKISYEITNRRSGDIAACYSDVKKSKKN